MANNGHKYWTSEENRASVRIDDITRTLLNHNIILNIKCITRARRKLFGCITGTQFNLA